MRRTIILAFTMLVILFVALGSWLYFHQVYSVEAALSLANAQGVTSTIRYYESGFAFRVLPADLARCLGGPIDVRLDGLNIPQPVAGKLRGNRRIRCLELSNMSIGATEAELIRSLELLEVLQLIDCVGSEEDASVAGDDRDTHLRYFLATALKGDLACGVPPALRSALSKVQTVKIGSEHLECYLGSVGNSCPQMSELHLTGRWSHDCERSIQRCNSLMTLWLCVGASADCNEMVIKDIRSVKELTITKILPTFQRVRFDSLPELASIVIKGESLAKLEITALPKLESVELVGLSVLNIDCDRCPQLANLKLIRCSVSTEMATALANVADVQLHFEGCTILEGAEDILDRSKTH